AVWSQVYRDRPGLEPCSQLARAGRKSGSLQGSASLEPARSHSLDIASPAVLTAEHGPARGAVPDAFRCPDNWVAPARDYDGRAARGLLAAGAQAGPGWTGRPGAGLPGCSCFHLFGAGRQAGAEHGGAPPEPRGRHHPRRLLDHDLAPERSLAEPTAAALACRAACRPGI